MSADILLLTSKPSRGIKLSSVLSVGGYTVQTAGTLQDALNTESLQQDYSVAILDESLSVPDWELMLSRLKQNFPSMQLIQLVNSSKIGSGSGSSEDEVFWKLSEPFENEELLYLVARGVIMSHLHSENAQLKEVLRAPIAPAELIAQSEPMRKLFDRLQKVASLDATVLLTGESGTGKTLIASVLHKLSDRVAQPFMALSCANFPRDLLDAELFGHERGAFTGASMARPGVIELCDRGTLFLDEIGELPLELQPKLLTFLQDKSIRRLAGKTTKTVDVRIICATNRDLERDVRSGSFRQDLFYRINVIHLHIPPLRDRCEDIEPLAKRVLAGIAERRKVKSRWTLSKSALSLLQAHPWPGNVRELEHTLERATAFAQNSTINSGDLELKRETTVYETPHTFVGMTLQEMEELLIRETLEHCSGDKAKAAKMLGISLKTIYNKLEKNKKMAKQNKSLPISEISS